MDAAAQFGELHEPALLSAAVEDGHVVVAVEVEHADGAAVPADVRADGVDDGRFSFAQEEERLAGEVAPREDGFRRERMAPGEGYDAAAGAEGQEGGAFGAGRGGPGDEEDIDGAAEGGAHGGEAVRLVREGHDLKGHGRRARPSTFSTGIISASTARMPTTDRNDQQKTPFLFRKGSFLHAKSGSGEPPFL